MKKSIDLNLEEISSGIIINCISHNGRVFGYELRGERVCSGIKAGYCRFRGEKRQENPFPSCDKPNYYVRWLEENKGEITP